jgi:hypothetical protein
MSKLATAKGICSASASSKRIDAWPSAALLCACPTVMPAETDPIKRQLAAHWDRRAAHFDEDFGHSIRTPAERGAWDLILDLILLLRDR